MYIYIHSISMCPVIIGIGLLHSGPKKAMDNFFDGQGFQVAGSCAAAPSLKHMVDVNHG